MPARLLGNFDFQSGRNAEPCSARRQTSGVFAGQCPVLQPGATLRFVGNKLCFVTNHMQNKLPVNDLLELPLARPAASRPWDDASRQQNAPSCRRDHPFSRQNEAFSAGGRPVLGPERFVLRPCLTLLRPEQSVLHAEQPVPRPWPTVLPAERVIPRPRQDEPPRSKADMSKTENRNSFQIFSLTAAPHHRNSGSLASSPQKGAKGAQAIRR